MKIKNILFAVSPLIVAPSIAQTEKTPNIILIMADDLGWGDVGFNGNKEIKTPYMDGLASEGVIFEQFYSAAPLSSPTRASVLTGRNAYRMGVFAPNIGILRPEEITIPELLKEKGYMTGHFGKWHLGALTCKEVDANRGKPGNEYLVNPPSVHGYTEAFVTESKVPTYDPMRAPISNDGRFWDYIKEGEESKPYGTSYWNINGNKITDNLEGDDSRLIIDRTLPFIDKAQKEKKPFLATVWFHAPHMPCVAGPEHVKLYKDMPLKKRNYYGCITAMDEQIGRLVDYLKSSGVYDNTVIFFCSDNGPEINTPGNAGNYKGRKRSLHEGGIRVPAFMIDGRKNTKGVVTQPCSTSDYLPTIMDIAKIEKSKAINELDGESFIPFIGSGNSDRNNPLVFCSGTQGSVVTSDYKLYYNNGKYELYNLKNDPFENNDLSKSNPDKVKELGDYLSLQINSYKASFKGTEYGTESVERMKQKWDNIYHIKNKDKNKSKK